VSDDGASAIVLIAMVGNPFSPYYARQRARGEASALRYCSMNVALYGPRRRSSEGPSAWALDERAIRPDDRGPTLLTIGHSTMRWDGDRLVIDLDERTTPAPIYNPFRRPVRGRVVVHPEAMPGLELAIDAQGAHRWWPVAPLARIEVDLREPAVKFSGHGYHDANTGDAPLESSFDTWGWSRARADDVACLTYDVRCASGAELNHAFTVDARGSVRPLERTWRTPLARSSWGLARHARVDLGEGARIERSLEDGPFYTRSLVGTRLMGQPVLAVHETLAAHRLRRRWVRFCTTYRMRTADPRG
jgi:carotenoid 1,2-hydratase